MTDEGTPRANRPLAGIVVLDLGQVYQGPYATMLMAKAGADVIKIEPPQGEPLRRRAPPGKSTTFPIAMLNGNKRAITLNLKHARGRDLLFHMARKGDVLLENFAPGVMDRLGVGWNVLHEINPRLVYASGTGYGLSGPDRDNLAMDLTVQAMGGLISVTGLADGPPVKAGPAVVDFLSGIHLYAATLTALFERERTGKGRLVEVAMQEAAYATLTSQLEAYWHTGKVPPRTGNSSHGRVPINVYPTNDGYVAMNLAVEEHWHSLLKAMGREDLRDDPRFKTNAARVAHIGETDALVGRVDTDPQQDGSVHNHQGAPRCATSARSCATRTCTSAACSNESTTTKSAISSSRPRHSVFMVPTG
jgi:CoA:oxalate CoA-transferase